MKPGVDVVFTGCAHAEPCPGIVRPCSVDVFGVMELRHVREDGRLIARLDSGEFEMFEADELGTVDAVAKAAAASVDDGYLDYDPEAGKGVE